MKTLNLAKLVSVMSIDGQEITADTLPQQRVSKPSHVDWHMIQDSELSQLSSPEDGLMFSIGLTSVGATVGLLGPFVSVLSRVTDKQSNVTEVLEIQAVDITYTVGFAACASVAFICLIFGGMARWQQRGLADKIRRRGQKPNNDIPKRKLFACMWGKANV